jgi:hypothetical protein
MDALSALAIAASAAQFLEFGTSLVAGTVERYRSADGAAQSNLDIEALAGRIKELVNGLDPYHIYDGSSGISHYGRQLKAIVKECRDVADQLVLILDGLKSHGKHKLIGSLLTSAKELRKGSQIQTLQRRLLSLQGQLSSCLVAMIQ